MSTPEDGMNTPSPAYLHVYRPWCRVCGFSLINMVCPALNSEWHRALARKEGA